MITKYVSRCCAKKKTPDRRRRSNKYTLINIIDGKLCAEIIARKEMFMKERKKQFEPKQCGAAVSVQVAQKSPEFRCKVNADVLVADQPLADIKSRITIYFVFGVIKHRSAFGGGRLRFRWRLHSD